MIHNHKGSAVVEMTIIMPIVFAIIVLVIFSFLNCKQAGETQCTGYTKLYVESEEKSFGNASDRLRRLQFYGDVLCE